MNGKYLLLGSNLGDKHENIKSALWLLSEKAGRVVSLSSVYKTSSWGNTDQPDYLNQVIRIETSLAPEKLMKEILAIENKLGRTRSKKWESRLIDIDILYYDNLILENGDLQIPHPRIPFRKFTLVPLTELAPDETHPVLGMTQKQLLSKTTDKGKVEKQEGSVVKNPD